MYELKQAGPASFYIDCPAKIGVYKQNDTDIYLIDSGNDKEAGKKALKIARQNNWTIRAVINTHSHADHIGGNAYLQQQTGCRIFAPGIEAAFTRYPILEPAFLYGAYPFRELRSKFLLARESRVEDIPGAEFPEELEVIPLDGHAFAMIGIRTPDDTVFLADSLSSRATLEKYRIAFIYDVTGYLNTLERVETLQAALFVPAHAEAGPDIKELVAVNRNQVYEIADRLTEICRVPADIENMLRQLCDAYGLTLSIEQYVLTGSTLRSYLAWLKDTGRITCRIEANRLLWERL